MARYQLIACDALDSLENFNKMVSAALNDGAELYGSPFIHNANLNYEYCQAVIYPTPKEEKPQPEDDRTQQILREIRADIEAWALRIHKKGERLPSATLDQWHRLVWELIQNENRPQQILRKIQGDIEACVCRIRKTGERPPSSTLDEWHRQVSKLIQNKRKSA